MVGGARNISIVPVIDKKILRRLVNRFSDVPYGSHEKYQDHLFNQYKLYVEMADQISSRRQIVNSFFLSINTALISLLGYLTINDSSQSDPFFYLLMAGVGAGLNYLWYNFIKSCGILNDAKFKIINKIEKFLPLNIYDTEWESVERGETLKFYLTFTSIEIRIPCLFILLHVSVVAWGYFKLLFPRFWE